MQIISGFIFAAPAFFRMAGFALQTENAPRKMSLNYPPDKVYLLVVVSCNKITNSRFKHIEMN